MALCTASTPSTHDLHTRVNCCSRIPEMKLGVALRLDLHGDMCMGREGGEGGVASAACMYDRGCRFVVNAYHHRRAAPCPHALLVCLCLVSSFYRVLC